MSRIYNLIVVFFVGFLSYEYFSINSGMVPSALKHLEQRGQLPFALSLDPGRPLSLWLGWAGLTLMLLMNLYSMRKRLQFMSGWGKLSAWMDFHIFCGLLGPTFILFHCNFKVRGLVGISFWSMVVSFTSGIIGRYFFLQISGKQAELVELSEKWQRRLKRVLEASKISWDQIEFEMYSHQAFRLVGFPEDVKVSNPVAALFRALMGDVRRGFIGVKKPSHWPKLTGHILTEYALTKRRAAFLDSFRRLMGYWHAFHFPFAVFMYLAAVIHVTAALIFGV